MKYELFNNSKKLRHLTTICNIERLRYLISTIDSRRAGSVSCCLQRQALLHTALLSGKVHCWYPNLAQCW